MAFSPTGQESGIAGAINPISHQHARSKSSHGKRGSVSSPTERTGLTNGQTTSYAAVVKKNTGADEHDHDDHDHDSHGNGKKDVHAHNHSEAEEGGHSHGGGGHGHSHGNMNAQGVFLHVLGDA
jgi:zinc transporter 1